MNKSKHLKGNQYPYVISPTADAREMSEVI